MLLYKTLVTILRHDHVWFPKHSNVILCSIKLSQHDKWLARKSKQFKEKETPFHHATIVTRTPKHDIE